MQIYKRPEATIIEVIGSYDSQGSVKVKLEVEKDKIHFYFRVGGFDFRHIKTLTANQAEWISDNLYNTWNAACDGEYRFHAKKGALEISWSDGHLVEIRNTKGDRNSFSCFALQGYDEEALKVADAFFSAADVVRARAKRLKKSR